MTLQQEAREAALKYYHVDEEMLEQQEFDSVKKKVEGFIAGANSEHVKREKIEFAIEQFKELNNTLESKRVTLTKMLAEKVGKITYERLNAKIHGLDFTKEDLRRQIQELEKQLKENT